MPAARHTLMTWKGVLGPAQSPVEEWQVSLKSGWGTEDAAGPSDPTAQANLLFTAMASTLMLQAAPHVTLRSAEFRAIGADGKQLRNTAGAFVGVGFSNAAPVGGGGSGTGVMPPQAALCVSLVSGRSGPTGKGRFWFPLGAAAIGSDLRLGAQAQEVWTDYAQAFVNAVNVAHGRVRVYSTKGTPGSDVVAIKVGRAVDTQRRRRGDLLESYRQASIA
jgi:hypothetical protein